MSFLLFKTIQSVFAPDDDEEESEEDLAKLAKRKPQLSTKIEARTASKQSTRLELNEEEKQELMVIFKKKKLFSILT